MRNRIYSYCTLRVYPNRWDNTATEFRRREGAIADLGGHLYGVWASQIGPSVNTLAVITDWPDEDTAKQRNKTVLEGIDDVVGYEIENLVPTLRPIDNTSPEGPGVFTHRWFHVGETDWDIFLTLSGDSWSEWEATYETRLYGFWKSLSASDGIARVLLCCRYPSLAVWERSRFWSADPSPAALAALDKQRRRREVTLDTYVSVMRLL